jgi:hypothetical protein
VIAAVLLAGLAYSWLDRKTEGRKDGRAEERKKGSLRELSEHPEGSEGAVIPALAPSLRSG